MKKWHRVISANLLATCSASFSLSAQQATARPAPTVLFVCEHGTVRSLLAKVLFEEYAAEVGLRMQALSRGTRADSTVPAWMQQELSGDRIELGTWRPQTLAPSDLANASYIVSFDVPPSYTSGTHAPRIQWDGLPSVSKDYTTGRDAIKVRVHALVDSLKRVQAQEKRE